MKKILCLIDSLNSGGAQRQLVGLAIMLKNAGYDLMQLVNEDIQNNRADYHIETIDKNIDFRRVRNIKVFLDKYTEKLTLDADDYENWQAGDIVVYENHIAIVSDKRNKSGINYIIHHQSQYINHFHFFV